MYTHNGLRAVFLVRRLSNMGTYILLSRVTLPNTVILAPTTFVWSPPITLPIVCLFQR